MKFLNMKNITQREAERKEIQRQVRMRLEWASSVCEPELMKCLHSSSEGVSVKHIDELRTRYGSGALPDHRGPGFLSAAVLSFVNPFTVILTAVGVLSFAADKAASFSGQGDYSELVIIGIMIAVSGILQFLQKMKNNRAAGEMKKRLPETAAVRRQERGLFSMPLEEAVTGDMMYLSPGDIVPADIRLLEGSRISVSQAVLTGESRVVEKSGGRKGEEEGAVTDYHNLIFMGTRVIGGSGRGIALSVGMQTLYGEMAAQLGYGAGNTEFEKGIRRISHLLIRWMVFMVPAVWVINGFTKGNWTEAALFALSVAVGLTPEMLPVIVSACLAKGTAAMNRQKTAVKSPGAMQNIGAMDILCTDKTGTVTQGNMDADDFYDAWGRFSKKAAELAFLGSLYQSGGSMDEAVQKNIREKRLLELSAYEHVSCTGKIPFDFKRRRSTVVIRDRHQYMITRGASEEVLSVCCAVRRDGEIVPIDSRVLQTIKKQAELMNEKGFTLLALASKTVEDGSRMWGPGDERDMVFEGWIVFRDPVKKSAYSAVRQLQCEGVNIKILTGDTAAAAQSVCRRLGISCRSVITGPEMEKMGEKELGKRTEETVIFARMCPEQKAQVIRLLRGRGHVTGYMGDGMNDLPAMEAADVSFAVDTAADAAREAAQVILMQPDLTVLVKAVREGRRTYINMIKYIKITVSSNFGNALSILAASIFLPFLPMQPIQLLLLNMVYDLSCTALPWDNTDPELLEKPRTWNTDSLSKFMLWMGPASSFFDMVTFGGLYFILCPLMTDSLFGMKNAAAHLYFEQMFQTGWFVESLWSQMLIIHMLRTPRIPFLQSRASGQVEIFTASALTAVMLLPFTHGGSYLGLVPLPPVYFAALTCLLTAYIFTVYILKRRFIRFYGELL